MIYRAHSDTNFRSFVDALDDTGVVFEVLDHERVQVIDDSANPDGADTLATIWGLDKEDASDN